MKKLLQILLIFCFITLFAQNRPDNTFVKENFIKKEVYIPMRDGVKLFTSIYIPKDISRTKKYPFIIQRTRILATDGTKIRTSVISTASAVKSNSLLESRFRQGKRVNWVDESRSVVAVWEAASGEGVPVSVVFSTTAIACASNAR